MFTGIIPALITPFRDGVVDEPAFRDYIEWLVASGVHGVVPCGTTGEAGALSSEEYARVVRIAVSQVRQRVPVIAGAGANITTRAVELSKLCAECGADALLHVTPYYNKPTPEGLWLHYSTIAAATPLPVILYNVPGRTGLNLQPATVQRLATLSTVVGLKDACGNVEQSRATLTGVPKSFTVLSGDDPLNLPLYRLGARGTITVVGNVAPRLMVEQWDAHRAGNHAHADALDRPLQALATALFLESNPIPVKTALALMGKCGESWRLPLCAMEAANRATLADVLQREGVL